MFGLSVTQSRSPVGLFELLASRRTICRCSNHVSDCINKTKQWNKLVVYDIGWCVEATEQQQQQFVGKVSMDAYACYRIIWFRLRVCECRFWRIDVTPSAKHAVSFTSYPYQLVSASFCPQLHMAQMICCVQPSRSQQYFFSSLYTPTAWMTFVRQSKRTKKKQRNKKQQCIGASEKY